MKSEILETYNIYNQIDVGAIKIHVMIVEIKSKIGPRVKL